MNADEITDVSRRRGSVLLLLAIFVLVAGHAYSWEAAGHLAAGSLTVSGLNLIAKTTNVRVVRIRREQLFQEQNRQGAKHD